jgi:protoheme IX farnesyltransferase
MSTMTNLGQSGVRPERNRVAAVAPAVTKFMDENSQPAYIGDLAHSRTFTQTVKQYLLLTKPTIMLLVLFTGATALIMEGSFLSQPLNFLLVMVGLFLTGGSANALNQYFEREIDAKMERTARRRPLPMHNLSSAQALGFAITIGVLGVALFAFRFNWLTALLALSTLLFYSLFYTLWLKPYTWHNIVIGGAAGAMAPVGAWTAATGKMGIEPWLLFLIIFLWTPPHFWALALYCKDDYVKARLPMLPVVKGDSATMRQILAYSFVLVAVSLAVYVAGARWFYIVSAALLGIWLVKRGLEASRLRTEKSFRSLFGYSIIYLFALFTAMIVDTVVRRVL